MALGGFAPLPLPLGGTAVDGLTAEQHARIAADLKALVGSAPFAVYSSAVPGSYLAQYGVGVNAAPLVSSGGLGITNFSWAVSYADEYDNVYPTHIRHAIASPVWNGAPVWCSVELLSYTTLAVYTTDNAHNLVTASFTLVVW